MSPSGVLVSAPDTFLSCDFFLAARFGLIVCIFICDLLVNDEVFFGLPWLPHTICPDLDVLGDRCSTEDFFLPPTFTPCSPAAFSAEEMPSFILFVSPNLSFGTFVLPFCLPEESLLSTALDTAFDFRQDVKCCCPDCHCLGRVFFVPETQTICKEEKYIDVGVGRCYSVPYHTWWLCVRSRYQLTGNSNYIPQYLWDAITCSCSW